MESELCRGLLQCSCYTEVWSVLTACRNCAVLEQCWVCVVCWSLSYAVKILLLLDMANMDRLLCV